MKTRGRYKVALERKLINAYQPALYTFYIKLCPVWVDRLPKVPILDQIDF